MVLPMVFLIVVKRAFIFTCNKPSVKANCYINAPLHLDGVNFYALQARAHFISLTFD
jgi:hypothetical protein